MADRWDEATVRPAQDSRRSYGSRSLDAVSDCACVYLLRCGDGSLYCGWTTDLDRRVSQHQAGAASRYTRSRQPVELAWSAAMSSRREAMSEEARIKRLPRREKLRLVG